jgi:hypothetical protein
MDDITNNTKEAVIELKKYREEIIQTALARAAEKGIEKQNAIIISAITARRIKARKEEIEDFDIMEKRFEELQKKSKEQGRLFGADLAEFSRLKLTTPLGDDFQSIENSKENIK